MFLATQTYTGSWQMVFYVASAMAFTAGLLALLLLKPMRARLVAASQ